MIMDQQNKSRLTRDIFYPTSVAIFGSSARRGYYWIYSLIDNGFDGAIYPIHPTRKSGAGLPFYKNVNDVPGLIDYAIVAVPARFVMDVIKDCVKKKIKFVHIFTSGFSESGEEGNQLENEVLQLARSNGILINGPNCLGIYCPKSGLSFRSDLFQHGEGFVSFISQSGGIANNLVLRGHKQNLSFSKVVSLGN
jgi:acetyltransferase